MLLVRVCGGGRRVQFSLRVRHVGRGYRYDDGAFGRGVKCRAELKYGHQASEAVRNQEVERSCALGMGYAFLGFWYSLFERFSTHACLHFYILLNSAEFPDS